MLVSDLVSQYHNSLNSGSKIATRTKGVEQLSKTVSSLEKGQIFEGTVNSVKGDKVVLSLSSGQNVTARLDKSMNLTEGQSVFFQVKSNEGGTIQIRPVSSEFGGNPTLLAALKGAGLPENETNLKLVNAMMREQMPIDKDSIKDMVKILRANPDANIDTLVSLKKLDLPINQSMITQFENYKESEGAILKMVDNLSEEIPKVLSGENISKEDVLSFQKDLINTLTGESEDSPLLPLNERLASAIASGDGEAIAKTLSQIEKMSIPTGGDAAKVSMAADGVNPSDTIKQAVSPDADSVITDTNTSGKLENKENFFKDSIGAVLDKPERTALNKALGELPQIREKLPVLFDANGNIKEEIKGSDLLKLVNSYAADNPGVNKEGLMKFLDSAPVKHLINNLMGEAFTIEPRELTKKHAVDKLYEKIEEDMEKISQSAKQATHSENNLISLTANSVKDNLSFIREVNQLYQYVQIPLQMSGEKTTGELFVYSNKKQKRAENDEITAFLHFDMENLGSTDISVKLAGKKLDTRFFLDDDISYQIIEQNLPILEERLSELGYDCKLTAENDAKKINFVEDFLKQDVKSAGDIHRYSFDVRA